MDHFTSDIITSKGIKYLPPGISLGNPLSL